MSDNIDIPRSRRDLFTIMLVKFSCKKDLDYFVSKEADHWWYMSVMYHARIESDLMFSVDEKFRYVVEHNPDLFSRPVYRKVGARYEIQKLVRMEGVVIE